MHQLLILTGIILPVILAVPSTGLPSSRDGSTPASALPFSTFDRHDLDAAHLAVTFAMRDLIPAYHNITPRNLAAVDSSHGLAKKQPPPTRLDTQKGKCSARCQKVGDREEPISLKVFVDYDDHAFGFYRNNDEPTSLVLRDLVEEHYETGSGFDDNLISVPCTATRGDYPPDDGSGRCCYIHWTWQQRMRYSDTAHDYQFPDPAAVMDPAFIEIIAYVLCFEVVMGARTCSITSSNRYECQFEKVKWDLNNPPPAL